MYFTSLYTAYASFIINDSCTVLCRSLQFLVPIATIHDTCTNGSNGPCDIGITLHTSISQDTVGRKGVCGTIYCSWERDACEVKFGYRVARASHCAAIVSGMTHFVLFMPASCIIFNESCQKIHVRDEANSTALLHVYVYIPHISSM